MRWEGGENRGKRNCFKHRACRHDFCNRELLEGLEGPERLLTGIVRRERDQDNTPGD